jgi:hypothetical protein
MEISAHAIVMNHTRIPGQSERWGTAPHIRPGIIAGYDVVFSETDTRSIMSL